MKQLISLYSLIFSFLFCTLNSFCFKEFPQSYSQEGFCADILVKTVDGYKLIQDFLPGDIVVDYHNNEKEIVSINKKFVKQYMCLVINDIVMNVGCDQQYCVLPDHRWISAKNIKKGDILLNHRDECCNVINVEVIEREALLHSFTVEDHVFYIVPYDICVHNAEALALSASSICLGYITTLNPIITTIGATVALSSIAYKAYQDYTQRFSSHDQQAVLPQEVHLAERSYYEQRKASLETIKQELLCIKNDLLHIKALCGNGFTHQFLQQNNVTHLCNSPQLLKISAAQEMQLSDKQKTDIRTLREAELAALEQDIIILQSMLALHCNTVVEHVQAIISEYKIVKEQTGITRELWNNNKCNITDSIALQSYKAELIEEFVVYNFSQKIDELKAIAYYYRNCINKCLKESTNIVDCLQEIETLIPEWDCELQKEKSYLIGNMSISAQHFERRGISVVGIRNEVKNVLEKAQKDNAAKALAQIQNKLSSMVSSGGPYKDPKDDKEPEKVERKVNTITKTEFFQKVRDQYEHWQNNIYRRKCGTKGIENAEYLRWDHLHNDVEAYTAGRKHLGSINPQTLKLYKGPVIGRKPF